MEALSLRAAPTAMNRIESCFSHLLEKKRTALIPYVAAGDPHPDLTVPVMLRLAQDGADLIELGVPFSDPMADGPAIQGAHERALRHHVNLNDVLDMAARFREQDTRTPVVLMSYLNPLEKMGYGAFAARAEEAGVDGILLVDMPPEENTHRQLFLNHGMRQIFLVSPTTPQKRMQQIAELAGGFLYYVSLKGVTGSKDLDIDGVRANLKELRQWTRTPIAVGFGIRSAKDAAGLLGSCDALVIGSSLVERIDRLQDAEPAQLLDELGSFITELRDTLDKGVPRE